MTDLAMSKKISLGKFFYVGESFKSIGATVLALIEINQIYLRQF